MSPLQRPSRSRRTRRLVLAAAGAALLATAAVPRGHLPTAPGPRLGARSPEQAAIEAREICVGSSVASAGSLADVLYYRAARLPGGELAVGYFAFFSEERPWGNNWLTWTVLPALAMDLFYSRALLVAPGLQRAMYGKGDVEGFRVFYDVGVDGSLAMNRAVADDGNHDEVSLVPGDARSTDPARLVFYSDVWSHQLGGRGARSPAELAYLRCYRDEALRPLPEAIAEDFDVERRAGPAHVESLGGLPVDAI